MDIPHTIQSILGGSKERGTFFVPDLVRFAKEGGISGIAAAQEPDKAFYLAFIRGEVEGAVYLDEKGELYGDKAGILVTGREKFVLYEAPCDLVETVVMGSRLFEKAHIKKGGTGMMPEVGRKSSGIGHLSLVVRKNGEPQNGIRISIRQGGRVLGSDITTQDGSAGFRVMFGDYDCIVQDRDQMIRKIPVQFREENQKIVLDT
jgi:hypothetical protein